MYKGTFKIIYFTIIISFLIFCFVFYFSDENTNKILENRKEYSKNIENKKLDLPFLQNDTNNIIEYNYENLDEKKYKRRYFWKLLDKDE
tara:strand:- start:199 stop:465 length:267 start_codon:yes stop_codon:yes gene_type:complete